MSNRAKGEIDEDGDLDMPLSQWRTLINRLIREHGQQSMMRTDAGYNNVSLVITPVPLKARDCNNRRVKKS